jgi:hypothetical protein
VERRPFCRAPTRKELPDGTPSADQGTARLRLRRDDPAGVEIDSGDEVTFQTGDAAYERLSKGEAVEAIV